MFDREKLNQAVEQYSSELDHRWPRVKYRWEAVQCFQQHWEPEAEDFAGMLSGALEKSGKLLSSRHLSSRKRIPDLAREAPEEVRAMFRNLFDESLGIWGRMEAFRGKAQELEEKYGGSNEDHSPGKTEISTYLWLRYPDRYYIYEYSPLSRAKKELQADCRFRRGADEENIRTGFELCDEICGELQKNEGLKNLVDAHLTDSCYPDPALHVLTADFVYYLSDLEKSKKDHKAVWIPDSSGPEKEQEEAQPEAMKLKMGLKQSDGGLMPPPWLAHPELERSSNAWNKGESAEYLGWFQSWLDALTPEERAEYRSLFPEPVAWKGWWDGEDDRKVLRQGRFEVQIWRPESRPEYSRERLQQESAAGKKREICFFFHAQASLDGGLAEGCFSQWWMEDFQSGKNTFCCMEQYMMAAKAALFGDEEIREQILSSSDPKEIKGLGRKVSGFDSEVWDRFKYSIVLNGNWCKFSQNRDLREFLLSTGDSILAEASPYDAIWGIHLSADDPDAQDPENWQGENLLGSALMEVRDELRRVYQNETLCTWSLAEASVPAAGQDGGFKQEYKNS